MSELIDTKYFTNDVNNNSFYINDYICFGRIQNILAASNQFKRDLDNNTINNNIQNETVYGGTILANTIDRFYIPAMTGQWYVHTLEALYKGKPPYTRGYLVTHDSINERNDLEGIISLVSDYAGIGFRVTNEEANNLGIQVISRYGWDGNFKDDLPNYDFLTGSEPFYELDEFFGYPTCFFVDQSKIDDILVPIFKKIAETEKYNNLEKGYDKISFFGDDINNLYGCCLNIPNGEYMHGRLILNDERNKIKAFVFFDHYVPNTFSDLLIDGICMYTNDDIINFNINKLTNSKIAEIVPSTINESEDKFIEYISKCYENNKNLDLLWKENKKNLIIRLINKNYINGLKKLLEFEDDKISITLTEMGRIHPESNEMLDVLFDYDINFNYQLLLDEGANGELKYAKPYYLLFLENSNDYNNVLNLLIQKNKIDLNIIFYTRNYFEHEPFYMFSALDELLVIILYIFLRIKDKNKRNKTETETEIFLKEHSNLISAYHTMKENNVALLFFTPIEENIINNNIENDENLNEIKDYFEDMDDMNETINSLYDVLRMINNFNN